MNDGGCFVNIKIEVIENYLFLFAAYGTANNVSTFPSIPNIIMKIAQSPRT